MNVTEQPSRGDRILALVAGLLMVVASPFIVVLICRPISATELIAATVFSAAAVVSAALLIS